MEGAEVYVYDTLTLQKSRVARNHPGGKAPPAPPNAALHVVLLLNVGLEFASFLLIKLLITVKATRGKFYVSGPLVT